MNAAFRSISYPQYSYHSLLHSSHPPKNMKSDRGMIFHEPCGSSRLVSVWVGTRSLFWISNPNLACTSGPVIGRWNFFLERNFPLRALGGSGKVSARALAKRVGADQLIMYVHILLS